MTSPCPQCGEPREDHSPKDLLVHTFLALGMTKEQAEATTSRVYKRLGRWTSGEEAK